jgi:hypothetical protein
VDHSCSVAALDPGSVNSRLQLGANLIQDEEENKRGPHHFTAFADSLLAQCVDRVALIQPLHGNSTTCSITKEFVTTTTQIDSSLEDV